MKKLFVLFLLLPCAAFAADAHNHPAKVIAETSRTIAGQEITVPEKPKVVASIVTLAPGKSLPVHKHPYPRYAYVQKGELEVTLVDSDKKLRYKAGDFVAEIIDGWHSGTNIGKTPVEILVIDQLPQDARSNTVIRE